VKYDNKMPDLLEGEPWFLIRGRDVLAVDSIRAYANKAVEASSKTNGDIDRANALTRHAVQCLQIAERFMDWQHANPDKIREPKPEPRKKP
jgi:hypothetical protein